MPSSCVYRKYLSDYQTINELVWCSMKRLNFRLGTKSCNGQTFAKPEFIPISGIRSLAQTTSKRENLTAFHLPASQSLTPRRSPPHNGNAAMNKKQRVLHIVGKNLTRIARPETIIPRDMKKTYRQSFIAASIESRRRRSPCTQSIELSRRPFFDLVNARTLAR